MSSNIPQSFYCPITKCIMTNPYIDNDGITYEYNAIKNWLVNNNTSPITRNTLTLEDLKPNRSLLDIIENYNNTYTYISDEFKLDKDVFDLNIYKHYDTENTYYNLNINPINPLNAPLAPLDLILVIDISKSMDDLAIIPNNIESEKLGYTILDITKHAINTVIETLKPNDRISIVTFSNEAKVMCELTNISQDNKSYIKDIIKNLDTIGATNMWSGLNVGLQQATKCPNRNSALLFLTDGIPTECLLPPRGISETLQNKITKMKNNNFNIPNIYTLGFGYSLDTELLDNIAKIGNGYFSFIPDSGFVGTNIIHTMAYIYTIICNNVYIDFHHNLGDKLEIIAYNSNKLVNLNTLNYGLKRNIILKIPNDYLQHIYNISFTINYKKTDDTYNNTLNYNINLTDNFDNNSNVINEINRLELVKILYNSTQETLKDNLNNNYPEELLNDINQLIMAVDDEYYTKWGKNYIYSFTNAHLQERCNNFKDKSIQKYTGLLFENIKENIDEIFNNIPPPIPSAFKKKERNRFGRHNNRIIYSRQIQNSDSDDDNTTVNVRHLNPAQSFSRSFNNTDNGCFHEDTKILMFNKTFKCIKDLKKGDFIIDKNGNKSSVICLIKNACYNNKCSMVELNDGTIITPYHPVLCNETNEWIFPYTKGIVKEYDTNYVYNLVLDTNHNIISNKTICVTLGHNINTNFVVSHDYYGTEKVINDLKLINGYESGLVTIYSSQLIRSKDTNRVIGIKTI